MIEHFNLEQLPATYQITGHFDVCLDWRRVARRVIVHEHNGRCRADHGWAEHFARMHQDRIQGAGGNEAMALNLPARELEPDDFHPPIYPVGAWKRLQVSCNSK